MTPYLDPTHRRELVEQSTIDPAVVDERGYETVTRPSPADQRPRQRLTQLGIPTWATSEDADFPGLLIPMYGPTGQRVTCQFKPRRPVRNRDGKLMKYASPRGQGSRLDIHPRNFAKLADPTIPLWVTEGVKKGDALTSHGQCVVSLTGVFNWRSTLGTLGDWEDVPLRGRHVLVCYDADVRTKPDVLRAMVRLGRWLTSKNVKKVHYLIVPADIGGTQVKGVDDFFAAGGTLDQLLATAGPPTPENADDTFTDARLAETIADDILTDKFIWVAGMGWLAWDGQRWAACSDVSVGEAVRQYTLTRFARALDELRANSQTGNTTAVTGWLSMLSASRERAVLGLARGIVERRVAELDHDPDLLNTPTGVVDLPTGTLLPATPDMLMTKITGVGYRPGATHPDWDTALQALPDGVRDWYQLRLGQAVTGHMTPDDLLVVAQGGGENGKSTINATTAKAAGGYYLLASDRLLLSSPEQHPTELMDLQGVRYVVAEETPEARRLAVSRLKKTIGTPQITARRIRQDSVTFDATHSFFLSTNYRPIIEETDHGTWRRLALVRFPYTFRKTSESLVGPNDRYGDPTLRDRCWTDSDVHSAALAWMVEGARKWYSANRVMPPLPDQVVRDTRAWRTEADQVLSYADERLVFDMESHVMTMDLLDDVNEWLTSRGHHRWSDKTLAARFGDHDEVVRHRVEKRKMRQADGLSRPPSKTGHDSTVGVFGPKDSGVPSFYHAWLGLRFAVSEDFAADLQEEPKIQDHVPGVPGASVKPPIRAREGTQINVAHLAHDLATGDLESANGHHPRIPDGAWGPCHDCGKLTHRYGPGGNARCPACRAEVAP